MSPGAASDAFGPILQALGTLGLGAVVGSYLAGGKGRRETRAAALRALAVCESARWAPHRDGEPRFLDSARELEATAMIARGPEVAVENYLLLARAAYWLSLDSWEEDPDPEYGGGIASEFADLVRRSARLVRRGIWHPILGRWRLRSQVWEIRKASLGLPPGIAATVKRSIEHGI